VRTGRRAVVALIIVGLSSVPRAAAQSVDEVAGRVGAYVADFVPRVANVVATETFVQRWRVAGRGNRGSLQLKSDFLLVRPTAAADWLVFRDVAEVNGRPVRHEADRIVRLFTDAAADATAHAAQISFESVRYHAPGASVAITNPLLILALMQPHYQPRLRFTLGGEERSLGRGVRTLRFEESKPVAAAAPDDGASERANSLLGLLGRVRGNVWADTTTGRIVKTEARIGEGSTVSTSITTFAYDERLGLTVPTRMRTTWTHADKIRLVEGEATYGSFRRFEVRTESTIAQPSQP
jgi:hypothetical protein